ncbi:MAG TPA: glycosyltransferase [Xanthobacteraceae bacterium]|nr:glycosyltransferase [Xanthobacteraceae bacterium]
MLAQFLAALSLAIWVYLLFGRGGFWLSAERDDAPLSPDAGVPSDAPWPRVAVVIPARDEADGIAACVGSLLGQDYKGEYSIILIDDGSTDGTAAIARQAALEAGAAERLVIITGRPLPAGWTGKLWAVRQGIEAAAELAPEYLLLSDADIIYADSVLASLVARARAGSLVLTSLMVKLRCESLAELAFIPAFIFFFEMLYPFAWINRPRNATAGAAGGCMLVKTSALAKAGGIDVIRNALIDDCALARSLKAHGPIWLGLTQRAHSIRRYPGLSDIRHMVARSAYAQLNYSPAILAGVVAGMALTYLAPPLFALLGSGPASAMGLAAWALMAIAFQPTLRFYAVSPLWGVALPAIAFCYTLFTLDSALQYARGQGGLWKGRVQAG